MSETTDVTSGKAERDAKLQIEEDRVSGAQVSNLKDLDIVMHTWGCKVNMYDSGLLETKLHSHTAKSEKMNVGINPLHHQSGKRRVHVLNTCAVTQEASKEAAKKARQIKAQDPEALVVITGCGAQVDGSIFDTLEGADLIVANSHKADLDRLVSEHLDGKLDSKVFRSNIFRKNELEEGGGLEADHTRAFLKVQDGCNSFCSYCVIPFARGKSRSITVENLVRRTNELHTLGASEIVITGVHIADYRDPSSGELRHLEDLVEALLKNTKIPRIRISSLEPVELSDRILEMYNDERMCPHFHLSIQSACTSTLQRMRRKYTADDVERVFSRVETKLPHAFIGMDLIVGFPGETEDEFQETYMRLKRSFWSRIHVFPYSERPGTKALALEGNLPMKARKERAAFIREFSSERYRSKALGVIGQTKKGLILRSVKQAFGEAPEYQAITRDNWPIRLTSRALKPGFEVDLKVTKYVEPPKGRLDGWLEGHLAT